MKWSDSKFVKWTRRVCDRTPTARRWSTGKNLETTSALRSWPRLQPWDKGFRIYNATCHVHLFSRSFFSATKVLIRIFIAESELYFTFSSINHLMCSKQLRYSHRIAFDALTLRCPHHTHFPKSSQTAFYFNTTILTVFEVLCMSFLFCKVRTTIFYIFPFFIKYWRFFNLLFVRYL